MCERLLLLLLLLLRKLQVDNLSSYWIVGRHVSSEAIDTVPHAAKPDRTVRELDKVELRARASKREQEILRIGQLDGEDSTVPTRQNSELRHEAQDRRQAVARTLEIMSSSSSRSTRSAASHAGSGRMRST
jgi:hypothetical protein